MSSFGIFALVLTLCLLLYYVLMIAYDLHRVEKKESKHGESFSVSDMEGEEKPTVIPEADPETQEQPEPEEELSSEELQEEVQPQVPQEPTEAERKVTVEQEKLEPVKKQYASDMSDEDFTAMLLAGQEKGPKFGVKPMTPK